MTFGNEQSSIDVAHFLLNDHLRREVVDAAGAHVPLVGIGI
ncbi:MAG: hypothetical protein WBZ11_16570 [Candidatus Sulfotelmatobacter sp.]